MSEEITASTTDLRERSRAMGADYDGPDRDELIRSIMRKLAEDPTYREVYCEHCDQDVNQSARTCPFCGRSFYSYSGEEDEEIRQADEAMDAEISAKRLEQREAGKDREAEGRKRAKRPSTKRHVGKLREPPKPQTWGKERKAAEAQLREQRRSARKKGKKDGDKVHDPEARRQRLLAKLPLTDAEARKLTRAEAISLVTALGMSAKEAWGKKSAELVKGILDRQAKRDPPPQDIF